MKLPNFLIALLFVAAPTVRAQTMSCQAANQLSSKLRAEAVDYATSPDYARFRTKYNIGAIDTSTIAVVSQDSICDAVTRAINSVAITQHASAFVVVKFGSMYAAVDSAGTDISAVYILDDQTRVKTVFVGT